MSINSSNIDKWLFDYYEGNLSPDDIRKLEQFLKKNPEYYEDADAWKDSFVEEPLPAFNPAFLVKEQQTSGNRRKLVYAALLLLLLSGSTLYFLFPSDNTAPNQHAAGDVTAHAENTNIFAATGSNTKTTPAPPAPVNNGHATAGRTETFSGAAVINSNLSFTPEIERLERMAAQYQANNNNINTVNNHYYTVVNQTPALTYQQHTATVQNNTLNPAANSHTVRTVNAGEPHTLVNNNTSQHPNNTTSPENGSVTANDNNPVVVNAVDPALTEVKTFNLNSGQAEVLNLTIENNENNTVQNTADAGTEKGSTAVNNAESKNVQEPLANEPKNKTVQDPAVNNQENKTVAAEGKKAEKNGVNEDRPSDLNPDALLARNKNDENTKSVEIERNNKTDIPMPKGLGFTNRRQVTLLQNINGEFENNAAFISQHHMIDAYTGVRFINASPIERGMGEVLGGSQYFRKTKTSLNVYGHHNKTGQIEQTGINLQVATQFKIDRFQSIIPSLSVSANRYDFAPIQEVATGKLAEYNMIPSYSAGQLTTSPVYYNYQDATKMNVSAGVLYHHKKFFAALSLNGLLQPKFTYELKDREYTATNYATANFVAGTDFVSKKYPELSLSPQLTINIRNLEPDFAGGAVLRYKSWGVGAGISASGALNTYAGYTHRTFGLQYRFVYDKLDAPFKGVSGHYMTMNINLKRFIKKGEVILNSEK